MHRPLFQSLTARISLLILLVESAVLLGFGLYYYERFSRSIDERVQEQVTLPGVLMNRQLLRYESVMDEKVMTQLLGESFVDGMVVDNRKNIFYALHAEDVGKNVADIEGLDPAWFDSAIRTTRVIRAADTGNEFLLAVTPMIAYEGATPYFFSFFKIRTNASEARKDEIAALFIAGSIFCILLTSLALIALTRRMLTGPIEDLEQSAVRLAAGELDTRIDKAGDDEIGRLAESLEAMRHAISRKIIQLEEVNHTMEHKEQRLQALVDALPDMVFVFDAEGRHLEARVPQGVIPAEDAENIRGRLLHEVLPRRLADRLLEVVQRTIRTGEPQRLEYEVDQYDPPRWFEGRTSLVDRRSNEEGLVVFVARGITGRKRLEQSLRAAKEEAEAANRRLVEVDRLKTAFLSSVSHELRTPLTSLLGFARLISKSFARHFVPLARGDEDLDRQGKRIMDNLSIIEQEGRRLTRLINDVLDLSKIESGRMEWRDADIAPAESIEKAVQIVRGHYMEKPGVALLLQLEHPLPTVHMDPDRMQQVLINLLTNAVKFTDEGSVTVSAEAHNGDLLVRVADTGMGIAPEECERIFDMFHQVAAHEIVDGDPVGTGLGLTICRQIVERYGGTIWVESQPGKGSVFAFRIPVNN